MFVLCLFFSYFFQSINKILLTEPQWDYSDRTMECRYNWAAIKKHQLALLKTVLELDPQIFTFFPLCSANTWLTILFQPMFLYCVFNSTLIYQQNVLPAQHQSLRQTGGGSRCAASCPGGSPLTCTTLAVSVADGISRCASFVRTHSLHGHVLFCFLEVVVLPWLTVDEKIAPVRSGGRT